MELAGSRLGRLGSVLAGRVRRRCWALVGIGLVMVGTAVRTWVFPLVVRGAHHRLLTVWWVPGDIWGTLRDGQVVAWLDFGHLYQAGTSLVAPPGAALLLAPVAVCVDAWHLSTDFPLVVPHPTAWLLLAPWAVAISGVALFALDALAERLGVRGWRRALLGVAGAGLVFPVVGLWGHPEDCVALGLFLYALAAALDGRVVAAGWLTGAALAVQPLVILAVPVLLGVLGLRQLPSFLLRAALPLVALLIPVFAAAPGATWRAVVDQPNFPGVDHVTPWTALAPRLGGRGRSLVVAGGPGRALAMVLALGLWPLARQWRDKPGRLVGLVSLALWLRCATESVMDPYYLWPALAVGVLAASPGTGWELGTATLLAGAVTVLAELHLAWLAWWLATVLGSALVVAVALRQGIRWAALVPAAGDSSSSGRCVPLEHQGAREPERPQVPSDPTPVVARTGP